jgi:hypothetical protein
MLWGIKNKSGAERAGDRINLIFFLPCIKKNHIKSVMGIGSLFFKGKYAEKIKKWCMQHPRPAL